MTYFIGTSGWSYEHWFNGVFYPKNYPKSKAFEYYQSQFSTVELNVTFYRLLSRSTFEGWFNKTKEDFIFAVKGSRFITQNKKLSDAEEPLERFFERVEGLKQKAGPVLWQLGPNLKKNTKKLLNFIDLLPGNYKHAFEFRHQSWFEEDVYRILKNKNISLVFADSPMWPYVENITADFIYVRFHGGKVLYGSQYSVNELEEWAKKFKKWHSEGLDIYAYFNNDSMGYAPKNALELKKLI